MAAVTICSDFGAPKNKVWHCFHGFAIYFPWSDGTRCYNRFYECWASSQLFPLSFSSRDFLVPLHFLPFAYLRLLIFLPAILIPACASSRPAFCMMYSAYELIKQGDDIQPWCTPFPILNQSVVPCPVISLLESSTKTYHVVLYSITLHKTQQGTPQSHHISPLFYNYLKARIQNIRTQL